MSGIVFENSLDHEVQVVIDGKVKAMLDPGESIAFDVREGQRIGYMKVGATAKSKLSLPAPSTRPQPHAASTEIIASPDSRKAGMRPASPVEQLNLDGSSVHVHPTLKAAAATVSVPWYEMAKHLEKGPDQEFKGFLWRRANGSATAPTTNEATSSSTDTGTTRRTGKPVIQRTKTGQALRIWPSQSDAAEALGISSSGISKVCNGVYPYAGGFAWEFARIES